MLFASERKRRPRQRCLTPGALNVSPTGCGDLHDSICGAARYWWHGAALSLDYSSQRGDGFSAWLVTFGLAINQPLRAHGRADAIHGGVNYDANDRFCLDGQRLILISGSYGAAGQ